MQRIFGIVGGREIAINLVLRVYREIAISKRSIPGIAGRPSRRRSHREERNKPWGTVVVVMAPPPPRRRRRTAPLLRASPTSPSSTTSPSSPRCSASPSRSPSSSSSPGNQFSIRSSSSSSSLASAPSSRLVWWCLAVESRPREGQSWSSLACFAQRGESLRYSDLALTTGSLRFSDFALLAGDAMLGWRMQFPLELLTSISLRIYKMSCEHKQIRRDLCKLSITFGVPGRNLDFFSFNASLDCNPHI